MERNPCLYAVAEERKNNVALTFLRVRKLQRLP